MYFDIKEEKHGFYEFVYAWKVLIYRFKLTKDKKHVWIKLKDKAEKRELMRDKDGNYYCKGVNLNVYIYKCDLVRVKELHMDYCNSCSYLDYFTYLSKGLYLGCEICKKKEFHYHKICGKCYNSIYSKTIGFVKETIFVE
ncbi:5237_t:CDS:1 [Scutellospora calospora]|uniref:5237_t:CDS:1 n=1 Tax=Scutellospora calospora TaxID=85575 RepID=A0ACA9PDJ1_9GLOM|nr:5237_t:CDS:1 [Scutellospora calospora]